jgi:hypothetical protein
MYKHVSLMSDAGFVAILILLNTWYLRCISYILSLATVWYICHRSMVHVNDWYCCPSIMYHCHSITAICIMLRCDIVLYWDHDGTIDMRTINIILYQHFVTVRTSYVIGIKHNMCLFWENIIHVIMYLLYAYVFIILWFIIFMLSIYAHAILYCMETIDMGIVDMGIIIWGPLICASSQPTVRRFH